MPYVCEHPDFTVTVKSGFISDWQWAVHAAIEYHPGRSVFNRRQIEAEARLELMVGISKESLRGRTDGARTVVVFVEGDREISGFFRGLEQRASASIPSAIQGTGASNASPDRCLTFRVRSAHDRRM